MPNFTFFDFFLGDRLIEGSDRGDLLIGAFGDDVITGKGGNDLILGLLGADTLLGGDGEDAVFGGAGNDIVEGGEGDDQLYGDAGDDRVVGNRGNDEMFGGAGDDLLVWNNGDGSDLMDGGAGYDLVQVNFDTDLVDFDLQNKDVAFIGTTPQGVHFARIEVNDQTARGLFQLDIRDSEALETNFGGGDDRAVIAGDVLDRIHLDLDGGQGVDTLDLSQVSGGQHVDLATGKLGQSNAENFENAIGTELGDAIRGDAQDNVLFGLGGDDRLGGRGGDDILVANKGNDAVFGGGGDDLLVWNNGDGSDLMHGGAGYDRVQVNFDTDLVDDDLQNRDVGSFSVSDKGLLFARIEVNDQTERGLFQLDIRNTEVIETNFGGGDDTALIEDNILARAILDLDGGAGVDLLDFGGASSGVAVDLAAGSIANAASALPSASAGPVAAKVVSSTAVGFENVAGSDFDDVITGDDQDNVIRGGKGNDIMRGGDGADTFLFLESDAGVDVILDFEVGVDRLVFNTTDPEVTPDNLLAGLTQVGDDVQLSLNNKVITFAEAQITDFYADDFMIA